jgi:hypothetical protein
LVHAPVREEAEAGSPTFVSMPHAEDALGRGWMLIVRAAGEDWHKGLITGDAVAPTFAAWIAAEAYRARPDKP